ncbi:hypothetical protein L1987_85937 [Smallanthus sonchifolius]|uniref:Uncharacterized protein n=1 Tax=Smallanthus sonchifolius TaxID=185202 RepID=A0ACB8XYJ8_9ASTR|nr:hypothetical protein L1987_85937 [Smallanthus sonchifolius]
MHSPNDDLERSHPHRRRRRAPATCCTICYAWASFLIWTTLILLLIFGIAFFAFLRSNLPQVKVHQLDVYKLNITQPKNNNNKDMQLTIDVQMMVNVANNNKMTLVYGKLDVETKIEGFSLHDVSLDGFRQMPMTANDLKIHPREMRSAVNDGDGKELKLSADLHEMVVSLKMKGKIEFWFKGRMLSKLYLRVSCEGVEQARIDQSLPGDCNVKLEFFGNLIEASMEVMEISNGESKKFEMKELGPTDKEKGKKSSVSLCFMLLRK